MSRWGKFFALPLGDRARIVGYALLLPLVHIGLGWLGYRKLYHFLATHPSHPVASVKAENEMVEVARKTASLVSIAAQHGLFRATCLRQALLTWWLLRRRGIQTELRIGVQHREGKVYAHAWVKYGEIVISDGEQVENNFTAFDGLPEQ